MLDAQVAESEALAQAEAEVLAGYTKTRGEQPPVETTTEEPTDGAQATTVIEQPAEPTVGDLAAELRDLKARVTASQNDPSDVRKMHGQIGDINRTLQAMQTPAPPLVPDEGDAALDEAASEYPELAGPMVREIKALKARLFQQPVQVQEDPEARRSARQVERQQERQEDAIESLRDEHPDFETVRETPQYKTWLSSKTAEYQKKFTSTWNPAVVARGLSELKDSLKTREVKQNRLAGAITPQGVPQKVGQSTLSDEEALWAGYNKGLKRLAK